MPRAARFFGRLLALRWVVLAIYALVLPPAAWLAARVGQDNSIERLIVPTDVEAKAQRDFEEVFGGGEYAILVLEAPDPFAVAVLARLDALERELAKAPRVSSSSALSIHRRAKAGFEATPESAEAFRRFAAGSALLRKQGLVGDGFLAVALILDVRDREQRREALASVEAAIAATGGASGGESAPLTALRRIGQPYVTTYLDDATARSGPRGFALFMGLVVVLNLALYRSLRALMAFVITLGVSLALSIGFIGATGGTFSIVSPMVPMTILVTVTSTLVYLHSRFVDRAPGVELEAHHVEALTNKLVPCTASIAATAIGFAALAVSDIRPIREMGIWVAVGLGLSWVVVFTLFPVLQRVLRTPTREAKERAAPRFDRLIDRVPGATYRGRYAILLVALGLAGAGAGSLFGVPGLLPPMRLGIHPLEYVDRDTPLHADTSHMEARLPGLSIAEVWLKGGVGAVSEPEVLVGLHRFQQALEQDPEVGAVIGPTTILRLIRYVGGGGAGGAEAWPAEPDEVEQLAADLEALVPTEPLLQRFVQRRALGQTHLSVVTRAYDHEGFTRLRERIGQRWQEALRDTPALSAFEMRVVGLAPLQARMSQELVPTLVESFALTAVIVFATFLLVFRSGAARLMTMIPSLFAILVMFAFMRVTSIPLNVATILIASTVLGTSENDQIHFFWHFLERQREGGSVESALRHTLRVSGRAIFFATVINAGGFLAFASADLPPMRQFGVLSSVALTLSMIAGFTALPAALWLVLRAKPDPAADTSSPRPS